jgi:hypothetical protein
MTQIEFRIALEVELRARGIVPKRQQLRAFVARFWAPIREDPVPDDWADLYLLPRRLLPDCRRGTPCKEHGFRRRSWAC